MGLVYSLLSSSGIPRRRRQRASVMVRFWPSSSSRHVSEHLEVSLLCQRAQFIYKPNMVPRRKPQAYELKKKASGLIPSPHHQTSLYRIHYSPGAVWLSGTPIIDGRILPCITQGSNKKTLWSMLLMRYLQLDNTILAICYSSYVAILSPHFKCYNTPLSMRVVMNSD